MSVLKKTTLNFLSKNPKLVKIAQKISNAIPADPNVIFNRYHPADLFGNIRHGQAFMNPTANPELQRKKKYVLTDCDVPLAFQETLGTIIRSIDEVPEAEIKNSLFFIYFTCDSDALPAIRKITRAGGQYIPHFNLNDRDIRTDYRFVNRTAYNALRRTWAKAERVSHLFPIVHENLCEALEVTRRVEGDYVEIGVYLGGSALTALNYISEQKKSGPAKPRKAWLLDTFDGFNYKEAKESADVIWADTHKLYGPEGTKKYIADTLSDIDVPFELVEGNICTNALPQGITSIAVANVDVDLYEPTLAALHKVAPLMAKGGIIIAEDPAATPALYGAYLAMQEFLDSPAGADFMPLFKKGQYFLIRL